MESEDDSQRRLQSTLSASVSTCETADDRALSVAVTRLCNDLSANVSAASYLPVFKKRFKMQLFTPVTNVTWL